MIDTATMLREQIYSAVRAFTCATVAEAACRRIEEATKQRDLFIEPPAKPKQSAFEGFA